MTVPTSCFLQKQPVSAVQDMSFVTFKIRQIDFGNDDIKIYHWKSKLCVANNKSAKDFTT